MMNGPAKSKTNGQAGPAKTFIVEPPPVGTVVAPPDPLSFVDELPTKVRVVIQKEGDKRYAEGMRRASKLIAIAVGTLDGDNKQRILQLVTQLEDEAYAAEKVLRA